MACGVKFAKFMLIFFNTIFFLTGACLLAIGLWVRLDSNVWDRLDVDDDDPYLEYGAYLLIAIGGFILVTGFLGCCGAIRESTCMLGLFIIILVIVLLAEIAAGVIVLIYRDDFEKEVIDEMKDDFADDWSYNDDDEWSAFAKTMNILQREFECCGIDGPSEYDDVNMDGNAASVLCWRNSTSESKRYPPTCFKVLKVGEDKDTDDLACGEVDQNDLHEEGCREELKEFFERYAVIFVAIALGFACLQIFGLIFAICLCRVGGKGD